MKRPMSTFLSGSIVVIVLLVVLWATQRRLMYFPMGEVLAPADVGLPDAEVVAFTTADGITLHGWFVPAAHASAVGAPGVPASAVGASAPPASATPAPTTATPAPATAEPGTPRTLPPARFTVVVFNGNAGNRSYRAPLAAALRAHGLSVLLFDYRGYGGNQGTPSESGLAADARAARAFLLGRPDVDPDRLVYVGESLGTGVAVTLAAEHPPAALVLRSPFASMVEVGRTHYPILPVRWLLRDRYASIDRITRIRCPLLVIAGDRDGVIPLDHSQRLYDAAFAPKQLVIVPGADHNDAVFLSGGEMLSAIVTFLQRLEGDP